MKKASSDAGFFVGLGGEEEDRTPDLVIANDALSQLSYPPKGVNFRPIRTWPLYAARGWVGGRATTEKWVVQPACVGAWNNAVSTQMI